MRFARLETTLIAYATGSLVGLASVVLEASASGWTITAGGAAAYSAAGGVLAVLARILLGFRLRAQAARTGALGVLGAFLALDLLYFVNVRVLPGEHYLGQKSVAIDLGVFAGVSLFVYWVARSVRTQEVRARWAKPGSNLGALLLAANLGLILWCWPRAVGEVERAGDGPDLLLLVLDSVRPDHLGHYGYERPTSPSLDAVAPDARVFWNAYAGSSWTVPSVATLLSVGPGVSRLQASLVGRGYVTACFTDNPHLALGTDLLAGFDTIERSVNWWRRLLRHTVLGEVIERLFPGDDRQLVDKALRWMARQRGPFFLYAHLMDSHTPYRYPPLDDRKRPGRRIEFPHTGMPMTQTEAEDIVARYDAGVRSADTAAGRLLAAMRERGRPFLAIVTADHGESLGESGRWFHGGSLAPELLATPLIVLGEGVKADRIVGPVGHDSIPATFLAAAGLRCERCPETDLRSGRVSGVASGGLPPDLLYRVSGRYKLVLDQKNGKRTLYDRQRDPEERDDLSERLPEIAGAFASKLDQNKSEGHRTTEDLQRLRSLGYVY